MVQMKMQTSTELVLVMEPTWFSLEDWLKSDINHLGAYQKDPETTKVYTLQLACDISEGLLALHKEGYVHADLSPSTVMVNFPFSLDSELQLTSIIVQVTTLDSSQEQKDSPTRYRAKLFHFGVRNGLDVPITRAELPLALSRYRAPEQMESAKCKFAMDIYSLGQILVDFWFGTELRTFNRLDRLQNCNQDAEQYVSHQAAIEQCQTMSLEDAFTESRESGGWLQLPTRRYDALIRKCCDLHHNKRPNVADVKREISAVTQELDRHAKTPRNVTAELEANEDGTNV